ncbi:hypothetical protein [Streptomyces bikiniensis]|uniref:hypothetical protein n=1 Tax=Streptomyces bikiniensis TaxID=1896 RepID=UPI000526F40D|nr:hypothetical protein [Streptomyces bikiniensis]
MATPERAEPGREHVTMSELLASCAAARTLSTPPRPQAEDDARERDAAAYDRYGRAEDEAA